MKFLICKHCGNLVEVIEDSKAPIVCCGEKMHQLDPKAFDGAKEKHIPVVSQEGNVINVVVGSVEHPMEEKHYITWIEIVTKQGVQRKTLKPNDKPSAKFIITEEDELVKVYAYCNLHGLWISE